MILRLTTPDDVDAVMDMIDGGKAYLKEKGIDQWQNGYPNRQSILDDIRNGEGYVLEQDGKPVGTAMISFAGEKTYDTIEGKWLSDNPYSVFHRVAIDPSSKGSGLGVSLIELGSALTLEKGAASIRIDTHEDNHSMQRMLAKAGFSYCGIIYLDPAEGEDGKRLAYEKILA